MSARRPKRLSFIIPMHSLVVLAIGVAENLDPTPDEYTGNGDADGQVRTIGAQPPNESSGNEDAAIRREIVPADPRFGETEGTGLALRHAASAQRRAASTKSTCPTTWASSWSTETRHIEAGPGDDGWCGRTRPASSSSSVRTVDRGSFGPVFRSSTVARFRHFATVLGLMPSSWLNCASGACDCCIAALTAYVVVALP